MSLADTLRSFNPTHASHDVSTWVLTDAADTIRTLATLLDGVLADDPDAIRAAVAWLAANVDGGEA